MNQHPAKLACTASGMGFEEWRRRPVYRTQCFTFSVARQLCGINLKPGQGLAMAIGDTSGQGLDEFRCLPPFRTEQAKELRDRVAAHIKELRREVAVLC